MDVITLAVTIWLAISQRMLGNGSETLPNLSFTFPDEYNGVSIKGKMDFSNTILKGLRSIKVTFDDIQAEDEDENGNNKVCIKNLNIGDISLSSKYYADLTIMNIPIYGDGKFTFSLKDVKSKVCFDAVSNSTTIIKGLENLDIVMKYRHKPIDVKGFYKNPEANDLFMEAAELFNVYLAMWHNYEPEGAACFLSSLIQFAVNAHLGYDNNTLTFNGKECLWKGTPFGDLERIHFQTYMILLQDLIKFIQSNEME